MGAAGTRRGDVVAGPSPRANNAAHALRCAHDVVVAVPLPVAVAARARIAAHRMAANARRCARGPTGHRQAAARVRQRRRRAVLRTLRELDLPRRVVRAEDARLRLCDRVAQPPHRTRLRQPRPPRRVPALPGLHLQRAPADRTAPVRALVQGRTLRAATCRRGREGSRAVRPLPRRQHARRDRRDRNAQGRAGLAAAAGRHGRNAETQRRRGAPRVGEAVHRNRRQGQAPTARALCASGQLPDRHASHRAARRRRGDVPRGRERARRDRSHRVRHRHAGRDRTLR